MANTGRMMFPLNAGTSESAFATLVDGDNVYTGKNNADCKANVYKNVSVNPLLFTLGLENETDYVSAATPNIPVSSAIFTEIRKGPHNTGLATEIYFAAENRLIPSNNAFLPTPNYENKETTASHKVRLHDINLISTAANAKVTYSTSNTPATNIHGIDIDNYDYFILLNPDIIAKVGVDADSTVITDTVRPHFAKITRIISYDIFGDGIEFSPKYTGNIVKGTKLEIYKGPHKVNDTDVVAVSYGLRGDALATTNKYDKICIVNRPTFYFYNDRLEEKDQLDYNEKYTLTSVRQWETGPTFTSLTADVVTDHSIYELGSGTAYIRFTVSNKSSWDKLTEGMSIFESNNTYIGNVESLSSSGSGLNEVFYVKLDYARKAITASTTTTLKIGKTIQNVVFKTERKYGDTIQNLGRNKLDVVLVDNKLSGDEDDNSFNPIFWHKAFPDMKRHENDSTTPTANTAHGEMNGPSTYITFESAALKNDKIPLAIDSIVNSPKSKISKFASTKAIDNSGIQHLKYKEDSKMVIRNGLFSDTIKKRKLDHTVTTSSTKLKLNKKANEFDYNSILSTGDIIEIGDYYYRIGTVDPVVVDEDQTFGVTHNRLKTGKVWYASTTPPTVTNADILVSAYSNGKFNLGFAADTEIRTDQNNRITIDNHTIDKVNTKMNKSRISLNGFIGHELKVDYGDKTHKYVTIQEPTKTYYQRNPKERMYYFTGGFTLHEEVFNGLVEDIQSKNDMGRMEYNIMGRDNMSKLLSNTVNRDLNFSDDIVYSTLNPALNLTSTQTLSSALSLGGSTMRVSGQITPTKYTLFFDSSGNLIGEFNSYTHGGTLPNTYTDIVLKDYAYIGASNGATIYTYDPVSSVVSYVSGAKAISANLYETSYPTDFTSIAEKGIIFNDGMNYNYASSAFSYSKLEYTSNDDTLPPTKSLGYDITNITGIQKRNTNNTITDETLKGNFLLKLAKEDGIITTTLNKNILSATYLHVASIENVSDTKNIISVAPNFPVSLGIMERNTSDNRFDEGLAATKKAGLYLINSNIPLGGYIHKLQNEFKYYYGPKESYRYLDRQVFTEGTIVPNYSITGRNAEVTNYIYKVGKRPHKITGYCNGFRVLGNGNRIVEDSIDEGDWHKGADGTDNLTTVIDDDDDADDSFSLNSLVNNDYRARPYGLYATGDLFPDSYLRFNNMGSASNTNSLTNFGLLFENEGSKGTEVGHTQYYGKTKATVKTDRNYERSEISSSSLINPSLMKRWGIIRLVEATFDWHFNSVDFESLRDRSEIPRLPIKHYKKYDTNNSDAISTYTLYARPGDSIDGLTDISAAGFIGGINMTKVYLVSPNINRDYFNLNLLEKFGSSSTTFDPQNVILPIISKYSNIDASPVIVETGINAKTHYSKVLSALCKPVYGNTPTGTNATRPHGVSYPYGNTGTTTASNHIYDNCIAMFLKLRKTTKDSDTLLELTSSPLSLSTYNMETDGLDTSQECQLNANTSTNAPINSNKLTVIGTKTTSYPFINRDDFEGGITSGGSRSDHYNHSGTIVENDGEMYSAQMLIKPQFNITEDLNRNVGLSFTMDGSVDEKHYWLNYVPKLEGYYIVSNKLVDDTYLPIRYQSVIVNTGVPKYIGKIISHTQTTNGSGDAVHTLKFDRAIDVSVEGIQYRLMRISDTTFEDTPDYFEINTMHDKGLKYETISSDLLTGEIGGTASMYSEGVYSMYMLLDIDSSIAGISYNRIERRTIADASTMFTDAEEVDCYVTDGINSERKSMTVTKDTNILKFEYNGKLTGNGCVSFGKIFEITIPKKLDIKPTNCYLGTTFSIGSNVETEIATIAKESDLDLNIELSFTNHTDNIISSATGDVITCVDNAINISDGDLLYTQQGYLLGKVATNGVSNKTITLDDIIYVPIANTFNEIVKKKKRTVISQINFQDADALSAINYLAAKRGLDYKIENDTLTAKNMDDTYSLRHYYLDYEKSNNLIRVESNKTLFDKATKVIVQGDRVRAEIEMPPSKRKRVIRHVDTSIRNKTEAKIKAEQLLALYQTDIRKIKLKLQKEGLELLEAGDILTLDFPNHDIPRDDYQVFEIENVLSGVTTVTVGTYDKTIAERLTELTLNQKMQAFNIFSRNSVDALMGKVVFDGFNIQNQSTKYQVSSTTGTSVIGFTATLGFEVSLGFGSGTTTILKTYESEKDV